MRGSHKIIDWGHKAPASVYKIQQHRDPAFTQGWEADGEAREEGMQMFRYDVSEQNSRTIQKSNYLHEDCCVCVCSGYICW